jgi:hypothetical protein
MMTLKIASLIIAVIAASLFVAVPLTASAQVNIPILPRLSSQSATVTQSNINTDNDVQVAEATACQAVALIASINLCDNVITIPPEEEEDGIWCQEFQTEPTNPVITACYSTLEECEAHAENTEGLGGTIISECQEFEEVPADVDLCATVNLETGQANEVPCETLS